MLMKGKKGVILGVANHRSIAWGIFESLRNQGADITLTYMNDRMKDGVEKLFKKFDINDVELLECDVTNQETIDSTFKALGEKHGEIDFVVHCLAFADKSELEGEFYNTSREGYAMAGEVSSFSLVAISKAAQPYLSESASIVSLTYLGSERICTNYNVMGVAKAGLECSTRYLANDLGPQGVRVNSISAGPVNTLAARGIAGFTKMLTIQEKISPLRRVNTIDEIGDAAMFLCSDLSRGITSEVIHVDCGFSNVGVGPMEAYNLEK
ncbi:enoyl-(acyl carrier protein) reductase [Lentisphaera araneosa HTCC2155]|uniref:Enoyl-[acyl-carrier-protein] reductase [NADH] n=1 Tax=Lentisphaera araneosa HTCC2155 TaxID=313628 RepID=A6DIN9_9BACT|nr:enoyl-ACP reductase [Lentisphaera araneosa]EDM28325.1 enoyl-(acyl carrier protein) reductase [Lentisphaera araneosa HTCC2155]